MTCSYENILFWVCPVKLSVVPWDCRKVIRDVSLKFIKFETFTAGDSSLWLSYAILCVYSHMWLVNQIMRASPPRPLPHRPLIPQVKHEPHLKGLYSPHPQMQYFNLSLYKIHLIKWVGFLRNTHRQLTAMLDSYAKFLPHFQHSYTRIINYLTFIISPGVQMLQFFW